MVDEVKENNRRFSFVWQLLPGFISVLSLTVATLIVILIVSLTYAPLALNGGNISPLELFLIRVNTAVPYLILVSAIMALVGGAALLTKTFRSRMKHGKLLTLGAILFSIFVFLPFLPDIFGAFDPQLRSHFSLAMYQYLAEVPIIQASFILVTMFLGSALIFISGSSIFRKAIPVATLVVNVTLIILIWPYIHFYTVGPYFPVLNSQFTYQILSNFTSFIYSYHVYVLVFNNQRVPLNLDYVFLGSLMLLALIHIPFLRKMKT